MLKKNLKSLWIALLSTLPSKGLSGKLTWPFPLLPYVAIPNIILYYWYFDLLWPTLVKILDLHINSLNYLIAHVWCGTSEEDLIMKQHSFQGSSSNLILYLVSISLCVLVWVMNCWYKYSNTLWINGKKNHLI